MAKEQFFEVSSGSSGELVVTLRPKMLRVLPASTRAHLKQANKEALLALRTCLDWAIERMDEEQPAPPPRRRRRVPVQEEG